MRMTNFLRTPIRAEHQARMRDLQVTEHSLAGDPQPGDPYYPQTLKISFKTDESEVQVATLWEGLMVFLPDSTVGYPQNPSDVTLANFSGWSLLGDLILLTADFSLVEAFQRHIPLVKQPPSIVRYSKVRLTQEFLFTTLARVRLPVRVVESGNVVKLDNTDTQWHQKYIIAFLQGRAGVWCPSDSNDSASDFTNNPMPSVALTAGANNTLGVTCASRAAKIPSPSTPSWFDRQGDYDNISGETLVHASINNYHEEMSNPAHPIYSVIPLGAVISSATDAAFESSHLSSTVRTTIINQLTAVGPYRRIDIARPERPGREVSVYPQRPFPQYRINWKRDGTNEIHSLRLPISGHLYLQLSDGQYLFSSIPRSNNPDPNMKQTSNQLQLSVKQATRKYIDLPPERLMIDLIAGQLNSTIYAHLLEYDSKRTWAVFDGLGSGAESRLESLKAEAETNWNVDVLGFYIPRYASMKDYCSIYGYITEAAGRHNLSPEFLQAVFIGEGASNEMVPPFIPGKIIEAFQNLGMDLILYRSGQLPAGYPAYPPQILPSNIDEIDEYSFNLVTNGYLDPMTAAAVTRSREVTRHELGGYRTLQIANIAGWSTVVELVAAELHARLDEMIAYCSAHTPVISTDGETRRRYLAYIRFNVSPGTARLRADEIDSSEDNKGLKRWIGEWPAIGDLSDERYNSIQRVAIAEWFEEAGVYR